MEGRYYHPILAERLERAHLVALEVVQQLVVERGWFSAEASRYERAYVLEQEPQVLVLLEHID